MTLLVMNTTRLSELNAGQKGIIVRVGDVSSSLDFIQRLLEMGFLEGATIEVLHVGTLRKQNRPEDIPMAVRVRGSLLALRTSEACAIEVSLL